MEEVKPGDLAIVVKGLWPNVGRIVFVTHWLDKYDFTSMGLPPSPGWRVRSISPQPLETIRGPRRAGMTPVRSLRRIDPLAPEQMRRIAQRMATADFKEAIDDLAKVMQPRIEQEELSELEVGAR